MLKQLLGSALRCRRYQALNHEILLRVLTINLMILWLLWRSFQQSNSLPFVCEHARPQREHGAKL
jgi:hypothetical protein